MLALFCRQTVPCRVLSCPAPARTQPLLATLGYARARPRRRYSMVVLPKDQGGGLATSSSHGPTSKLTWLPKPASSVSVHGSKRHFHSSPPCRTCQVHVEHLEPRPGHEVAKVVISNPNKLNIVDSPGLEKLIEECQALMHRPNLRVVVLTSGKTAADKAPAFIGGADIKEMNQLSSSDEARAFIMRIHNVCVSLRDLPVPVIGRVHGHALGGGLEILAACDLRIATKASMFAMPEVRVGIPSVAEAALFPGLIGMARTRRLLYLAEYIDAFEAYNWGLVDRLVDDEAGLDDAVDEWTATICDMGPKAMRTQKKLMQRWENCTADEGVMAGIEAYADAYADGGKEPKEYMSKFLNRKR